MASITPFLWFDERLGEAMEHYAGVFDDFEIIEQQWYPEGVPEAGTGLMTATFRLNGRDYMCLNGGPHYKFTPAFSMFISCADQDEVDRYWDALLSGGGEPGRCGWLTDRYGLSWQVVPQALAQLLGDPDPGRANRAMQAMLGMNKLVVAELRAAAAG